MFGKLIRDKARSGEFFGFFDIFGKFSSIMGPALVGFVSAFTANKMLADQGLTAATATAEQVDAINAAAGPFGIFCPSSSSSLSVPCCTSPCCRKL